MKQNILKYYLSITLGLILSLHVLAQKSNWNTLGTLNGAAVVKIPSSLVLNLPTTNQYQIGFFIKKGDSLQNVGLSNYASGIDFNVNVAFDSQGLNGYKNGDKLISLLRDVVTKKVYGVEFNYFNNNNKFQSGGINQVQSLFGNTWEQFLSKGNYCQSFGKFTLKMPYGINPNVFYTNGLSLDKTGEYVIVDFGSSTTASHNIQVLSSTIEFTYGMNYFNIIKFPTSVLKPTYQICPTSPITLTSSDSLLKVFDNQQNNKTFTEAGQFIYSIKYIPNGCLTTDTLTISYKQDCPIIKEPQILAPLNGDVLIFSKSENIKVYNAKYELVDEFLGPFTWKGVNKSGSILSGGLYFIIHEDGSQESVTIYY